MSYLDVLLLSALLWVPIGALGALIAQSIVASIRERDESGPRLIVPFEACGFDPSFDVPAFEIENEPVDDEDLPTVRVQVPNVTRRQRGIR